LAPEISFLKNDFYIDYFFKGIAERVLGDLKKLLDFHFNFYLWFWGVGGEHCSLCGFYFSSFCLDFFFPSVN